MECIPTAVDGDCVYEKENNNFGLKPVNTWRKEIEFQRLGFARKKSEMIFRIALDVEVNTPDECLLLGYTQSIKCTLYPHTHILALALTQRMRRCTHEKHQHKHTISIHTQRSNFPALYIAYALFTHFAQRGWRYTVIWSVAERARVVSSMAPA